VTPDLAEAIRNACIAAATDAYEDAGFAGMCEEGRWERALDAIRALDLEAVLDGRPPAASEPSAGDRER
jgi:hypothetical protein